MKEKKAKYSKLHLRLTHLRPHYESVLELRCRGGFRIFLWGVDDTNRPSNYTLIYFMLSHVCSKTWRFRKDKGWLASQGFCNPHISIFFGDPCISVCFSTHYTFLVGCSKGGWLVTQSMPSGSAPEMFVLLRDNCLITRSKEGQSPTLSVSGVRNIPWCGRLISYVCRCETHI